VPPPIGSAPAGAHGVLTELVKSSRRSCAIAGGRAVLALAHGLQFQPMRRAAACTGGWRRTTVRSPREITMSAPVFVTFRHMSPRAELEEYAREQATRLDRFFARIVDCRVVLEPNDAGVLRAVVEVTVPGQRIVSSFEADPGRPAPAESDRPAPADAQWLRVLHEAFDAAGRMLKTYAGRRLTRTRSAVALHR
jgi:hypothetical protein